MKIQHVILGHSAHVLVVNGTRGPLQGCRDKPATHPSGYVAYRLRESAYDHGIPVALSGKVLMAVIPQDFERIEDTACEPAQEAYKAYTEIQDTCMQVKLARYAPLEESVDAAPPLA